MDFKLVKVSSNRNSCKKIAHFRVTVSVSADSFLSCATENGHSLSASLFASLMDSPCPQWECSWPKPFITSLDILLESRRPKDKPTVSYSLQSESPSVVLSAAPLPGGQALSSAKTLSRKSSLN